MIVNTKRFGEIKLIDNEKQIITFTSPILGFSNLSSYIVFQEESGPFEYLQSIEDEDLTFIIVDPFIFFSDYEFQLDSHWIDALEIKNDLDVSVRVIVTVRSANDITCNLKAPLIMNKQNNLAAQVVLDHGRYSTRHSLAVEVKGEGEHVDPIEK
ncbi:flagellar assembly protein FliW [Paenibacillus lautus]|uniref:flagellar assembly protein FliW n=1 Tax=Paenibacillus lautus TaxID=1401 RepID=UPI001C120E4A|nr:flagellar assembly protein FliW [Paenibacillus lautus]MBU5349287.1 flagellar assembly protein FliW [Paenibacillus lautus]